MLDDALWILVHRNADRQRIEAGVRLQGQQSDFNVRALAAPRLMVMLMFVFDGSEGLVQVWMRMRVWVRVMMSAPRCTGRFSLEHLGDLMLMTTAKADDNAALQAAEHTLEGDGGENEKCHDP